jgi:hypothetical protein
MCWFISKGSLEPWMWMVLIVGMLFGWSPKASCVLLILFIWMTMLCALYACVDFWRKSQRQLAEIYAELRLLTLAERKGCLARPANFLQNLWAHSWGDRKSTCCPMGLCKWVFFIVMQQWGFEKWEWGELSQYLINIPLYNFCIV